MQTRETSGPRLALQAVLLSQAREFEVLGFNLGSVCSALVFKTSSG